MTSISRIRPRRPGLVALAVASGLLAAALAGGTAAAADDWPSKPVTIVVPYGPGASNDLFGRMLAHVLRKNLGQPFVVENRPGAGGITGALYVSRAEPDGYTLLQHNIGIASAGPGQKIDFDAARDLTPLGMISKSPLAVMVNASIGANSVQEFVDWAKANPETTFFGTGAFGGLRHLQHAYFGIKTGTNLKAVAYNAGADIINDLAAGRLQLAFGSTSSATGPIEAGRVKVIAYTAPGAGEDAPEAPTLKEAGVDMEAVDWFAIFAPPSMPAALRDRINQAINEAIMDPEFEPLMKQTQANPAPMTAEEFADVVRQETATFIDLMEITGIKPQ